MQKPLPLDANEKGYDLHRIPRTAVSMEGTHDWRANTIGCVITLWNR